MLFLDIVITDNIEVSKAINWLEKLWGKIEIESVVVDIRFDLKTKK